MGETPMPLFEGPKKNYVGKALETWLCAEATIVLTAEQLRTADLFLLQATNNGF